MKSKRTAATTLALFLLMGCESSIVALPKVVPASNLTSNCIGLEQLQEGATMGDLLSVAIRNNQLYIECAKRHKELTELVK
jgi:hypothetical protein